MNRLASVFAMIQVLKAKKLSEVRPSSLLPLNPTEVLQCDP